MRNNSNSKPSNIDRRPRLENHVGISSQWLRIDMGRRNWLDVAEVGTKSTDGDGVSVAFYQNGFVCPHYLILLSRCSVKLWSSVNSRPNSFDDELSPDSERRLQCWRSLFCSGQCRGHPLHGTCALSSAHQFDFAMANNFANLRILAQYARG